jgi:hypothetical protein
MAGFITVYEVSWRTYHEQPLAFPHDLHAGTRQIDCKYCHRGTDKGMHAGVPSVQDCWQCHQNLLGKGTSGVEVIKQESVNKMLKQYVETKKEITWFKLYDMPEHVKFPHKAHINAGLDCTECHGDVKTMKVVTLKNRTHMGWCIECHRRKNAPYDCSVCHY